MTHVIDFRKVRITKDNLPFIAGMVTVPDQKNRIRIGDVITLSTCTEGQILVIHNKGEAMYWKDDGWDRIEKRSTTGTWIDSTGTIIFLDGRMIGLNFEDLKY